MPFEASKSAYRRQFDSRFATKYFIGKGIDIGCGPDPVSLYKEQFPLMTELKPWDLNDGDGMLLDEVEDESFDFVHASHSLEHMKNPTIALDNWIRVCKEGGHLIITIPDEDLFEQGKWPSPYAGADHITSWTISKSSSWAPQSRNVFDFLKSFNDKVTILKIELIDHLYAYTAEAFDQTRMPCTETAIEIILRKKTKEEREAKGRIPKPRNEVFTYKIG